MRRCSPLQVGHITGNDRGWGVGGTYTFSQSTFSDPSGVIQNGHMRTNEILFTVNLQRRLTRTRRLSLSAGAGPQQASGSSQLGGAEYWYWTPSVTGRSPTGYRAGLGIQCRLPERVDGARKHQPAAVLC